ncbi:hypothetical protein BU197_26930 [Streptomyces sp. CBMA291]|nr:hypothetical protein [Streptomyces sp. CBMA291]MBD0714669.1 hypothetical protein [Streptomyces sp. CBMA370]
MTDGSGTVGVAPADREGRGGARFAVRAKWPDDAGDFALVGGGRDPVLMVESLRRSAALLCRTELAVPPGHSLVIERLRYQVRPEFLEAPDGGAGLRMETVCSGVERDDGRATALTCGIRVRSGDRTVAAGEGRLGVVALRPLPVAGPPFASAVPVGSHLVGRTGTARVVLAPTPLSGCWQLRAGDTALFGPETGHYPDMALVEVAHQAARALLAPVPFHPVSFTVDVHRRAEFDPPCRIEAHTVPTPVPGGVAVRVTGVQGGRPVFTAVLTSAGR